MIEDAAGYRKLIDKLLYLTMSRPDMMFVVQTLSQFMQEPKNSHLDACQENSSIYQEQTRIGFTLPTKENFHTIAFCDSYWASYVTFQEDRSPDFASS